MGRAGLGSEGGVSAGGAAHGTRHTPPADHREPSCQLKPAPPGQASGALEGGRGGGGAELAAGWAVLPQLCARHYSGGHGCTRTHTACPQLCARHYPAPYSTRRQAQVYAVGYWLEGGAHTDTHVH